MAPLSFTLLIRAIFVGWLIALLIWMLPYAQSAHFFAIGLITWLIRIGHLSHIVPGAVEVSAAGWAGTAPWSMIVTQGANSAVAGSRRSFIIQ